MMHFSVCVTFTEEGGLFVTELQAPWGRWFCSARENWDQVWRVIKVRAYNYQLLCGTDAKARREPAKVVAWFWEELKLEQYSQELRLAGTRVTARSCSQFVAQLLALKISECQFASHVLGALESKLHSAWEDGKSGPQRRRTRPSRMTPVLWTELPLAAEHNHNALCCALLLSEAARARSVPKCLLPTPWDPLWRPECAFARNPDAATKS